jgi:hypothetical protein
MKTAFTKTFCLLLITQLLFTSCLRKMALKYVGVYDTALTPKKISNNEKEIVFLGMHHLGKHEFYDNAIEQLNTLKKEGYYVYYEGVIIDSTSDPLLIDTAYLKFRSLTGFDFSVMKKNKGYINTENSVSLLPDKKLNKIIQKEKFINQPADLVVPKESNSGKKVDANLIDLIEQYEKKYGTISLTQYDKNTPLGTTFDRTKKQSITQTQHNYLILDIRNIVLAVEILQSTHKKIAIVYGKAHYKGLLKLLKDADRGYNEIK